jgi:hypothetical protein
MTLTGRQARQFAEALRSAFPSQGDLQQLLLRGLGVNLNTIVGNDGTEKQINEILIWAQGQGRLDELVAAAREASPRNAAVAQLETDFARWVQEAAPVAGPGAAPAGAPVDASRLRRVLTEAFSVEELQLLCADVEQALAERGVTLMVDLETVGGESKPAQVLNLVQYLQRRNLLETLVAAARAARPGLL